MKFRHVVTVHVDTDERVAGKVMGWVQNALAYELGPGAKAVGCRREEGSDSVSEEDERLVGEAAAKSMANLKTAPMHRPSDALVEAQKKLDDLNGSWPWDGWDGAADARATHHRAVIAQEKIVAELRTKEAKPEASCGVCGHERIAHIGPNGVGLGSGPACHCGCDCFAPCPHTNWSYTMDRARRCNGCQATLPDVKLDGARTNEAKVRCEHEWQHRCGKCGEPSELDGCTETERSRAISALRKIASLSKHDDPIDQVAQEALACLLHDADPRTDSAQPKGPCDRCGTINATLKNEGPFVFCHDRTGCNIRKAERFAMCEHDNLRSRCGQCTEPVLPHTQNALHSEKKR
jgi:hypothetical protein